MTIKRNGDRVILKDGKVSCSCCGVYIGNGAEFWGDGRLPFKPEAELGEIKLMVYFKAAYCGAELPSIPPYSGSELYDWVRKGNVICVQDEFPDCGNSAAMNNFLSGIGSSIIMEESVPFPPSTWWSCGTTQYTATLLSHPVTVGLPTQFQGQATGNLLGGFPIINAPACPNDTLPGGGGTLGPGVALAGEQLGDGAIFVCVDSNITPSVQNISTNALKLIKDKQPLFNVLP